MFYYVITETLHILHSKSSLSQFYEQKSQPFTERCVMCAKWKREKKRKKTVSKNVVLTKFINLKKNNPFYLL